jgi:hypothetical protein
MAPARLGHPHAYVTAFFAMLATLGWQPDPSHE